MSIATEITMSSEGRVTIPKHIRQALGLKPGQKIWVAVGENRQEVIKPEAEDGSALFGMFKATQKVSIEEMSAESGPGDDLD